MLDVTTRRSSHECAAICEVIKARTDDHRDGRQRLLSLTRQPKPQVPDTCRAGGSSVKDRSSRYRQGLTELGSSSSQVLTFGQTWKRQSTPPLFDGLACSMRCSQIFIAPLDGLVRQVRVRELDGRASWRQERLPLRSSHIRRSGGTELESRSRSMARRRVERCRGVRNSTCHSCPAG